MKIDSHLDTDSIKTVANFNYLEVQTIEKPR